MTVIVTAMEPGLKENKLSPGPAATPSGPDTPPPTATPAATWHL